MKNRDFLKLLEEELKINELTIKIKMLSNENTSELLVQRSNIKDMIIAVLKNELMIQENRKAG